MAVTSQNGWSANNRSVVASYDLPGGRIAVRAGDVSVVLLWVAGEFHRRVEPLVWPGNWGYAERPIRGSSTTLSNHASGTAIDLNAPRHPLAKVGTFNAGQVSAIRDILGFCEGVVRWGGDYSGRKDEMHFEINAGSTAVARVADKIRNQPNAAPEDELSQQQVDQIITQLRRDMGYARDQMLTALGVGNPANAPTKLTPEQLAAIATARRADVGFARDQLIGELVSQRGELAAQRALIEGLADLIEAIAEKVGVPLTAPEGQS